MLFKFKLERIITDCLVGKYTDAPLTRIVENTTWGLISSRNIDGRIFTGLNRFCNDISYLEIPLK